MMGPNQNGDGLPEPDRTPVSDDIKRALDEARRDREFQERLQRRMAEDKPILGRLATPGPCPSKTLGVLGFAEPTVIPCGLAEGHPGWHSFTITWGED